VHSSARRSQRFPCTVGTRPEEALSGPPSTRLMAANSFSIEKGACTPDLQQADLKKTMMSIATKVYLLVDSSDGQRILRAFRPARRDRLPVTDAISPERRQGPRRYRGREY